MKESLQVVSWLNEYKKNFKLIVEKIKFSESKEWSFIDNKSKLVHRTGGFFSIVGLKFSSNFYKEKQFFQPIILQPEIGILGFLAKEENGVLYLLAQAKTEPGNVGFVQIAPTLQATESNYTALHGGSVPYYLNYFLDTSNHIVLVDQLQSEQGTRFFKKRNRNMVVLISSTTEIKETIHHRWISIESWKELLTIDHLVNTDSKSVIASLLFSSFMQKRSHYCCDEFSNAVQKSFQLTVSADFILAWISKLKAHYTLTSEIIPLSNMPSWEITDTSIKSILGNYFSIDQFSIYCDSREVSHWDQPLITSNEKGFVGLFCKITNGALELLLQARVEPGHFDKLELTTTLQIAIGEQESLSDSTMFMDLLKGDSVKTIIKGLSSEEGGRFNKDENEYCIVLIDEEPEIELPINYNWVSFSQLSELFLLNNFLTNELRSLLALMSSRF